MEDTKDCIGNRAIEKEVRQKKKEIASNLIVELNRAKPHIEDSKSHLFAQDFDRLKLQWHTLVVRVNPQFGGKTLLKNPCNDVVILVEKEMKIKVAGSLPNGDSHSVSFFFEDEKSLKAAKEKIYFKKMNNLLLTASLSENELLYRVLKKKIDPKTKHDPSSVYSLASLARMKLAPLTGMTRGEQLKWKEFVAKDFYAYFKKAYSNELRNLNIDEAGKTGLRSFFRKSKLPLEDERNSFIDNIERNCRLEDLQSVKGYTPAEFKLRHDLNLETIRFEQGIVLEHGRHATSYTSIMPLMFVPYADTRIMQIGKLLSPFTSQTYTSNKNVNYLVELQRDYSGAINVIVREYVFGTFENRPLLTETKMKLLDLLVKGDNFFNLNWIQMHSYVYGAKLSPDFNYKHMRKNSQKMASDLIWSRESVICKKNVLSDAIIEMGELTSKSVLALAQFFKPSHLTNECSNRCDFSYECIQNLSQVCKKVVLSKRHLENYSALDKTKFATISSPISANQTLFEMTSCLESRFARDNVTYFYTYADAIGNFYKSIRTCRPVKRIIYLASNADKIEEYCQYAKYPSDADLFIPTRIIPINLSFETLELNYLILLERKSFDDIRNIRIIPSKNIKDTPSVVKREEKHSIETFIEKPSVGKSEGLVKREVKSTAEKREEQLTVVKREQNQDDVSNKLTNFVPRKVLLNQGMSQKISHPLPRKFICIEEQPISRPEIRLQATPKIDSYAAIYDSVKTIKQNILNRSANALAKDDFLNNLRKFGNSTSDIFADLSTQEKPQHSSYKSTDIFPTEEHSDYSKSDYFDKSTSDITADLSTKEIQSTNRNSQYSSYKTTDVFPTEERIEYSKSDCFDQSTSDIMARLSAKEERVLAKDRFTSSKNLGELELGDSKSFSRTFGTPNNSNPHQSTSKFIDDALAKKRFFSESWNQSPPNGLASFSATKSQLDFQNIDITQPPPNVTANFRSAGSQLDSRNIDFTQPPPNQSIIHFSFGNSSHQPRKTRDFSVVENQLKNFDQSADLQKSDSSNGRDQSTLPSNNISALKEALLKTIGHTSLSTASSKSSPPFSQQKMDSLDDEDQAHFKRSATNLNDLSHLKRKQRKTMDWGTLTLLHDKMRGKNQGDKELSENGGGKHSNNWEVDSGKCYPPWQVDMRNVIQNRGDDFKKDSVNFGKDIRSNIRTPDMESDIEKSDNDANSVFQKSESGSHFGKDIRRIINAPNIAGDSRTDFPNIADDIRRDIPNILPNIAGDLRRDTPNFLPNIAGGIRRDIPNRLPNTVSDIQRDIPNILPNTADDIQRDIPNRVFNTVGDIQRDIPNILPSIERDIQSSVDVPYAGNNIRSNDSNISTESQWDRINSIIGGGIGGNGNIFDIGGGTSDSQPNTIFFNESNTNVPNTVAGYPPMQPPSMFSNVGNPALNFGNRGFQFDIKQSFLGSTKQQATSYMGQYDTQSVESACIRNERNSNFVDDNSKQFEFQNYFPPKEEKHFEISNPEYYEDANFNTRRETFDGGESEECLYSRRSPRNQPYERRERKGRYDPFE